MPRRSSSPPAADASLNPVAAIDIGSNSIKMTIGRVASDGSVEELAWASETVRLGAGLETSGKLADDRVEAAITTLARFAGIAREHEARAIVAVATEATRAATNGPAFLRQVRQSIGIDVRVIDGDEEAALTFRGLTAIADLSGQVVVADIGGGSTEVITAAEGVVISARSLPLGSGRLTDRLVDHDPPLAEELAACGKAATVAVAALDRELQLPTGSEVRLLVVGGTGEYLARLVENPAAISRAAIAAILRRLSAISASRLAEQLTIAQARARVLPAGVAIVGAFGDALDPGRIEVVRGGLRVGILLAESAREGHPDTFSRNHGIDA